MKKNKVIWLLGGFGNVLFHLFYAFLLRKNGFNVSISPTLTEKNFFTRIYGWTFHKPIYKRFCHEYKIVHPFLGKAIMPFIHKKTGLNLGVSFIDNSRNFIPPPKGNDLFGYFQNKEQIKAHSNSFLEFCSSIFSLLPDVEQHEYVVHFRGGDSLIAASHNGYYQQVGSQIKGHRAIIVADSIEHAQSFFGSGDNVTYLSSNNPLDDFTILTRATVLFCAPSTFSWWAMHINRNAKKVYIPKYFKDHLGVFRDDIEINTLPN